MRRLRDCLAAMYRARRMSPLGFLKTAGQLALIYVAAALLGGRACTSFLSGTWPTGEPDQLALLLGLFYVLAYFAFVLLAPILVLAAGLYGLLQFLIGGPARKRHWALASPRSIDSMHN